jgi:lipopolysaccharide export system protein LptA
MRAASALVAAVLVAVGTVAPAGATPAGARPGAIEVESDTLRIDHPAGRALFEGNVRAVYGEITLSCARLEVSYDRSGSVSSLAATGGVQVRRGQARATAATARLDAPAGLLVLEGQPQLLQGPNRLEGRRITVELHSGRIEVQGARGRFEVELGGAR